MQEPELPADEVARVATLRSLKILDTPRESQYDRYTRISARIFDTPISVISLVDRHRQWFKSAEGLDAEQTPRSISFCGHAILEDDVFEVPNALRDPRFRDNPLVIDQPFIRFYAGAPLRAPNGHKLGTLCIIDTVARRLSDEEKVMLKNLASMVMGEIIDNIDINTGLANRNALLTAGKDCFARPEPLRKFSLHLFDISDAEASSQESDAEIAPEETFGRLLTSYYPSAREIARIGENTFCVLLEPKEAFDERRAISHVSVAARKAFSFASSKQNFSTYVGMVQYKRRKHKSFDDVMRDVDAMFRRHERTPVAQAAASNRLADTWHKWLDAMH